MVWILATVVLLVVLLAIRHFRSTGRSARSDTLPDEAAKAEVYFKSMFPDLQPWYHPQKLVEFVSARRRRRVASHRGEKWENPPGLGVARALLKRHGGRERVRLADTNGTPLTEFVYEDHPGGGVLRVGKGKFVLRLQDATNPEVHYWHPEREFTWTRKGGWHFTTRVAEQSFAADDHGVRWSSDRDSHSFSSSSGGRFDDDSSNNCGSSDREGSLFTSSGDTDRIASVGMLAAGGAFGGAGASESWDRNGAADTRDANDPIGSSTAY